MNCHLYTIYDFLLLFWFVFVFFFRLVIFTRRTRSTFGYSVSDSFCCRFVSLFILYSDTILWNIFCFFCVDERFLFGRFFLLHIAVSTAFNAVQQTINLFPVSFCIRTCAAQITRLNKYHLYFCLVSSSSSFSFLCKAFGRFSTESVKIKVTDIFFPIHSIFMYVDCAATLISSFRFIYVLTTTIFFWYSRQFFIVLRFRLKLITCLNINLSSFHMVNRHFIFDACHVRWLPVERPRNELWHYF